MLTYVAASFAYADRDKTESRKIEIEKITKEVRKYLNSDFYLPHKLTIPNAWDISLEEWANQVFECDIAALGQADLVIFISYGKENNAGAVWEVGYAYAKNIPIVMIKMTDETESLMVTSSSRAIITKEEIASYDFKTLPRYITTVNKIS